MENSLPALLPCDFFRAAHLFRCAAAMRMRAAALIGRFFGAGPPAPLINLALVSSSISQPGCDQLFAAAEPRCNCPSVTIAATRDYPCFLRYSYSAGFVSANTSAAIMSPEIRSRRNRQGRRCRCRTCRYLNNVVEQDHRGIKVPLPKTKPVFPVSVLIKSAQSAWADTGTVNGEGKRVWTSRRNMRCPSARFRWPSCLKRTQTSPRSGRMREARTGLAKPRSRAGQSGLALAKGLSTHFGPCGPPKYRRRALHRTDPSKSNSPRRCPDRRPRLRPRFRRRPCCHCPRSRSSFPARSSAERPPQTRHSQTE
jgi:hypothetical protein